MFGKNKNKRVKICLMVVTTCLVLAVLWAVLATPETALAKKPDNPGGGEPEALHGTATFEDRDGDRVRSDDGGPYTYTGSGKGGAILLGLGNFFRLSVNVDKKVVGRRFDMNFTAPPLEVVDVNDDPITFDLTAFLPASEDFWVLYVQGTLQEWRDQPLYDDNVQSTEVKRVGRLRFGTKGVDYAYVNYGAAPTWDGAPLTVKRIGTDMWTIESKPGDAAHLFREKEVLFGYAPMPFLITYYGQ